MPGSVKNSHGLRNKGAWIGDRTENGIYINELEKIWNKIRQTPFKKNET